MWPCLFQRIPWWYCFSEGKWLLQYHWFCTSLGRSLLGMPKLLFGVSLAFYMCSHADTMMRHCKVLFILLVSQVSVISWRVPSTCLEHRGNLWNAGWISATLYHAAGHAFNQEAFFPAGQRFSISEKTWEKSRHIGDVTASSAIHKFYPKAEFGTVLPKL